MHDIRPGAVERLNEALTRHGVWSEFAVGERVVMQGDAGGGSSCCSRARLTSSCATNGVNIKEPRAAPNTTSPSSRRRRRSASRTSSSARRAAFKNFEANAKLSDDALTAFDRAPSAAAVENPGNADTATPASASPARRGDYFGERALLEDRPRAAWSSSSAIGRVAS